MARVKAVKRPFVPGLSVREQGRRDSRTAPPPGAPPGVSEQLMGFRPRQISEARYAPVRDLVVGLALAVSPHEVGPALECLKKLAPIAVYVRETGQALTSTTVLDPGTVAAFLAREQGHCTPGTHATTRSAVNRVRQAHGLAPRRHTAGRQPIVPHTPTERLHCYRSVGEDFPEPASSTLAVLDLSFGAGLAAEEARTRRGTDITPTRYGARVAVPERACGFVPVLGGYAVRLLALATLRQDEPMIMPGHSRRKAIELATRTLPRSLGFTMARAAGLWRTEWLSRPLPFLYVAAIAGFTPGSHTAHDLLRHMDPVDTDRLGALLERITP